jgi:hypothetical protein
MLVKRSDIKGTISRLSSESGRIDLQERTQRPGEIL